MQERIARQFQQFRPSISLFAAMISLSFVAWLYTTHATGNQIREPLTWDETLSLENYSWTAFKRDGNPVHIRRADDLLGQPKPSPTQFVAGLYRTIGGWREPNDHIPHNAMLNAAMLIAPSDERTSRLPAFMGGLIFVIACGCFARRCGEKASWQMAMILAASLPYVAAYSVQARGYSWMLALQVMQLLALSQVAKRPRSIIWGSVSASIGILTFLNIISLAVDWLLPLFAVFWLFPPVNVDEDQQHKDGSKSQRSDFRRNLVIQFLAIGLVGMLFLIDHLPYVALAMQEFGDVTPWRTLPARLGAVGEYLLPTLGWKVVAGLGVLGWALLISRRSGRTLGLLPPAVIGVSIAHFVSTQKVPYERTCGYVLPLLMIGWVELSERIYQTVPERIRHVSLITLVIASEIFGCLQLAGPLSQTSGIGEYAKQLKANQFSGTPYVCLDRDTYIRQRHLPGHYLTATDDAEVFNSTDCLILLGSPERTIGNPSQNWPMLPAGDLEIRHHPARQLSLTQDLIPARFPVVVLWIPQANRTGLRNEKIYESLGDAGGLMQKHYRPTFNKLEFSNSVYSTEFFITNLENFELVKSAVLRGLAGIGGKALVIEPLPE